MNPSVPWDRQGDINECDFPPHIQVWLSDNYFSTTAFNKCPCLKAKTIFSTAGGSGRAGRRRLEAVWGGGGAGSSVALIRDPKAARRIWVTLVAGFAEAQRLTSSQAGLCVTSAHLSEIFFQAINYYIWTSPPGSGEPLASCSKNQSSFTTFTLAALQLFIYVTRNLKMPYLFRWHRYIRKYDMSLITTIFFFSSLHELVCIGLTSKRWQVLLWEFLLSILIITSVASSTNCFVFPSSCFPVLSGMYGSSSEHSFYLIR